jgi:hypothetical protein
MEYSRGSEKYESLSLIDISKEKEAQCIEKIDTCSHMHFKANT